MQCVLPSEVAKIPPKISNQEVLLPQGHHNAWPEGSQLPLAFPSHVPTEPGQPPGVASAKSTGVEKYVGSARATLTEKNHLALDRGRYLNGVTHGARAKNFRPYFGAMIPGHIARTDAQSQRTNTATKPQRKTSAV